MDQLIEPDSALDEIDTSDDKLAEVHERAMKRFDEAAAATLDCRAASLAARRFITIPGAQWEDEWGDQWGKSIRVEVNKVARGVEKIESDYRENRIVPDFRPDGPKADQDTADMLDGLHRADSYRFKSQQARDNAAFEAFSGGFGAWRLTNEWEDESDKDNDNQCINPALIITDADQSVFFDTGAQLYDKADARWAFIRVSLTPDAFKSQYDREIPDSFPEGVYEHNIQDWFRGETVVVAEYYEREDVNDKLWIATHRDSGEERRLWASDLDDGELAGLKRDGWRMASQKRKRCRVHKYVLAGDEVLEDRGTIAGDCIPIVPVYGKRMFVAGVERWKGYVQDKMDAQRLYNSNVSRLAELNSLAPREVPIFAPEQMTPAIADQWARANIDRLPYLLAEPLRDPVSGTIVQNGPVSSVKPPDLPQALAALLQIANTDLTEDQEDGADTAKSNTSAEAMDIAATRVDAKSGPYLDNFRMSVQREGEIYLGMASELYADEGREVATMSEDGDDGRAKLKVTHTDSKTGNARTINDLEHARYKVIASVTEATATRRDKTVRAMLNMANVATQAQDMELAQASLITAGLNMDGEGIGDFEAWLRKRGLTMGLVQPNEEEQKAMETEAENQQPDPMNQLASAQAMDFAASAAKKQAETQGVAAKTDLTKAQTVETLHSISRDNTKSEAGIAQDNATTAAQVGVHHAHAHDKLASAHARLAPPFITAPRRAANGN